MKIANLSGKAEIFHTIQGEGLSSGLPSIFLRLSQCNLHCIWCDTDYTWNWVGTPFTHVKDNEPDYQKYRREEQILDIDTQELQQIIRSYRCDNLVVTGGEPLMQQKSLSDLLRNLKSDDVIRHIEIETNGTLVPESALDHYTDQYNVSIKLSNSGNPEKLRIKEGAIEFFAASPKANFKFVVAEPSDLKEIYSLINQFNIRPNQIILMPLGTDEEALNSRESWLSEICVKEGFRFSDRMHIRLFGNKRGV